jgi:hypothetical protein
MSGGRMPELLVTDDQLALVDIESLGDLWITFRDIFFPNPPEETMSRQPLTAPEENLGKVRNIDGSKGGINAN